MYLLAITGIILIISILVAIFFDDYEEAGIVVSFASGLVLFITLVILGISHGTASGTIAQYEIIKETIEVSRDNEISDIERATLTQKIIEVNQEIASYKHWNETNWDIFVPDELTKLEYLK